MAADLDMECRRRASLSSSDPPPGQRRFALLVTAVIGLIALGEIELTVLLLTLN